MRAFRPIRPSEGCHRLPGPRLGSGSACTRPTVATSPSAGAKRSKTCTTEHGSSSASKRNWFSIELKTDEGRQLSNIIYC